jgi:hypothetical protein
MARSRKRRPTLAQRGERADAASAARKRSVPAAIAVGAVVRTPVRVTGRTTARGSNAAAAGAAVGVVAYQGNKARRATKAKQGFKPVGYRGQVGRKKGRGGGHHGRHQRRDRYGRFA